MHVCMIRYIYWPCLKALPIFNNSNTYTSRGFPGVLETPSEILNWSCSYCILSYVYSLAAQISIQGEWQVSVVSYCPEGNL